MADSLHSIDRRCIFRETFQNEQSVRRNGGNPIGLTFQNGYATFGATGSAVLYKHQNKTRTVSVRFRARFRPQTTAWRMLLEEGSIYDTIAPNSFVLVPFPAGNHYINGTLGTSLIAEQWLDVVWAGIVFPNENTILIGGRWNNGSPIYSSSCDMDLFEVYSGTLTANEVKNLYENKRYKDVPAHAEQLGSELVVDGEFNNPANWNPSDGWTVGSGKANYDDVQGGAFIQPAVAVPLTAGKRYKITYTISGLTSGSATMNLSNQGGGAMLEMFATSYIGHSNGTYSFTLLCTNTATNYRVYAHTTSGSAWSLDNFSIKEVIVEPTKLILDVSAQDDVVRNKLTGDVYNEIITPDVNKYFTSDSTYWNKVGETTIGNGVCRILSTAGTASGISKDIIASGKTYQMNYEVVANNGGSLKFAAGVLYNGVAQIPSTVGKYQITIVSTTTTFYISRTTGVTDISITGLSLKEIIPSVVPTDISVVKENDIYAMKFNGTTSKIDCGSYDGLIGDKTFITWARQGELKPSSSLWNNSKVICYIASSSRILFTSDGGVTNAYSGVGSYPFNKTPLMLVITRTSTGIVNFYINGILSGTANQASGTPANGTTNLTIGNYSANYIKGLISSSRIHDGILPVQEISQLFTNEKVKYGL